MTLSSNQTNELVNLVWLLNVCDCFEDNIVDQSRITFYKAKCYCKHYIPSTLLMIRTFVAISLNL